MKTKASLLFIAIIYSSLLLADDKSTVSPSNPETAKGLSAFLSILEEWLPYGQSLEETKKKFGEPMSVDPVEGGKVVIFEEIPKPRKGGGIKKRVVGLRLVFVDDKLVSYQLIRQTSYKDEEK